MKSGPRGHLAFGQASAVSIQVTCGGSGPLIALQLRRAPSPTVPIVPELNRALGIKASIALVSTTRVMPLRRPAGLAWGKAPGSPMCCPGAGSRG